MTTRGIPRPAAPPRRRAFGTDQAVSASALTQHVWPALSKAIGGGTLHSLEGQKDRALRDLLDIHAGIDALWHHSKHGLRGVASRIQVCTTPWDTFTIRTARDSGTTTEFEKRQRAMEKGWLYPFLTVQAYMRTWDGPVLSVAAARTVDIFEFIDNGFADENRTTNATFAVVPWDALAKSGKTVIVVRPVAQDDEWDDFSDDSIWAEKP